MFRGQFLIKASAFSFHPFILSRWRCWPTTRPEIFRQEVSTHASFTGATNDLALDGRRGLHRRSPESKQRYPRRKLFRRVFLARRAQAPPRWPKVLRGSPSNTDTRIAAPAPPPREGGVDCAGVHFLRLKRNTIAPTGNENPRITGPYGPPEEKAVPKRVT